MIAGVISFATTQPLSAAEVPVIYKVGKVTWHAKKYVGKEITFQGYVLVTGKDYILFSDEASGAVSAHDLPVTGAGVEKLVSNTKYLLKGKLISGGLSASNGNPYHLELTSEPQIAKN